jgi:hypothetical protein
MSGNSRMPWCGSCAMCIIERPKIRGEPTGIPGDESNRDEERPPSGTQPSRQAPARPNVRPHGRLRAACNRTRGYDIVKQRDYEACEITLSFRLRPRSGSDKRRIAGDHATSGPRVLGRRFCSKVARPGLIQMRRPISTRETSRSIAQTASEVSRLRGR